MQKNNIHIDELYNFKTLENNLKSKCNIIILEETSSTNDYAKTINVEEKPFLILAKKQTKGKGRLGKTFHSPKNKGIYLSIVIKPNFSMEKLNLITPLAALATCEAIESTSNIQPKIKWVNDIIYNKRKIAGILTEATTNHLTGAIDKIIIGIGINFYESSSPLELKNKIGYLGNFTKNLNANPLIENLVNRITYYINNLNTKSDFSSDTLIENYKSKSLVIGKNVYLKNLITKTTVEVKVLDIDNQGRIIIEYQKGNKKGQIDTISSGEISLIGDFYE